MTSSATIKVLSLMTAALLSACKPTDYGVSSEAVLERIPDLKCLASVISANNPSTDPVFAEHVGVGHGTLRGLGPTAKVEFIYYAVDYIHYELQVRTEERKPIRFIHFGIFLKPASAEVLKGVDRHLRMINPAMQAQCGITDLTSKLSYQCWGDECQAAALSSNNSLQADRER